MDATLWRMPTRPTVTEDDGTERPATDRELLGRDIKLLGSHDGDELVHVAPGSRGTDALPDDATRIMGPVWSWGDLPEQASEVAEQVLHAIWTETRAVEGEQVEVRRRGPQGPARSRGNIPDALDTDLPPHFWAGDS